MLVSNKTLHCEAYKKWEFEYLMSIYTFQM